MKIKRKETYGAFLLRIRETAKITQEELALRLGVSEMSVWAWENGRNPSFARSLIKQSTMPIDMRRKSRSYPRRMRGLRIACDW